MNFRKELQNLSKNCVNTRVEEFKNELMKVAKNGHYNIIKFISVSDTIGLKAIEELKKLGLSVKEVELNSKEKIIISSNKRKFIISWEEELSEDDVAELADTDVYGHDYC